MNFLLHEISFGSPTSAKDLARMILYLINTNEYGTYHVTCSGVCNRYEFAQEILRLAGKNDESKGSADRTVRSFFCQTTICGTG